MWKNVITKNQLNTKKDSDGGNEGPAIGNVNTKWQNSKKEKHISYNNYFKFQTD